VDLGDCEPQSRPGPNRPAFEACSGADGVLAKLPERQAEVFVLSRIEGLDHAAIAEILDCTPNSVRVSLHRAVQQLASEMSDCLD
jgi:DNA-directed RNA polymerase specialized sigma24 family protein